MGRWGKGIFDSDTAMDCVDTIEARIKREIEYWVTPEQVANNGWWLAQVLTVIEIILLFEQHKIGLGGITIESETTIQRWRKNFMPIWDKEWKVDATYPIELDDYAYRLKHRIAVETMFSHLESTTYQWKRDTTNKQPTPLIPLLPDYPLPYFSIRRERHDDTEEVRVERFTSDLIEMLQKELIYWFSPEKRGEALAFNIASEEIPAVAELLAFFCEKYEQSPLITPEIVRNWCNLALEMMQEFDDDLTLSWSGEDERLKIIKMTFDKLEAIAKKYPPDILW